MLVNHNLKEKKPYVIGITGSFGSGKSTVGEMLSQRGVLVIDTDEIVRGLLKTRNNITKKIIEIFGKGILSNKPDEYINRKILADIVFSEPHKRKELESIIHPEVIKKLVEMTSHAKEQKIIAVLVPLLFETNLESLFNEIWCVTCNDEICFKRLLSKGYTNEEIQQRFDSQFTQKQKAKLSNYVVDNSGDINNTRQLVLKLVERLELLS